MDTLIGDITPPDELMKTLTDRKIADQRKVTFDSQRLAEDNRRELEKSKAMADTQASVVTAERSVAIAGYAADAAIKQAEGQAKAKTVNAEADATVTKVNGEAAAAVTTVTGQADAGKTLSVGTAEADVIKLKIASMTSDNYAVIETAKALCRQRIQTGAGHRRQRRRRRVEFADEYFPGAADQGFEQRFERDVSDEEVRGAGNRPHVHGKTGACFVRIDPIR